ncbi:MAG: 1-acyl-sn-glycerol-3-phosphate acyltransferase [Lachnospiraceae bacterium]|nr:1-acyl-sn-glycerol-3-phosphate acyltransferase [Lachnospiraceae bacterium]
MLRLIILGIAAFLFFAAAVIYMPVVYFIGLFSLDARHIISYRFGQLALKIALFISGTKVEVKGRENLPKPGEAVLYIGNHRSIYDIIISYSMVPPLTGYISKKEIKKVPILSWWMHLLNCLFLDRDNAKEGLKTILAAIEMVKGGKSVFIFPEGTRSKTDQMLEFKEGSFKIAQKSGCPIIPVAFNNTSAIFEDHFPRIKKTNVCIEFGKPIIISELAPENQKHVGKYTQNIIKDMVEKNAIK